VRAVLDCNVLISAVLSPGGVPAELIRRWRVGGFQIVVSEDLLHELVRTLAYTKLRARIPPEEVRHLLDELRAGAHFAADVQDPEARSVDPADDYLIALAEAEQAVLVSGDRHLLDLADRFPIQTPRAFLDSLSEPE
jgi:putative PIN family toxin of toxin-antitoxin system